MYLYEKAVYFYSVSIRNLFLRRFSYLWNVKSVHYGYACLLNFSSPLTTWSGSSDVVKLTSVHSRDLASSFETVAPPEPPSPISGLKPWSFNVHFCGPPCIAKGLIVHSSAVFREEVIIIMVLSFRHSADQNGFLGAAVCDFPDFTFVQSIKHGKPIIRNKKAAVKMNNQNKVPSQTVTPSAPKSKSLLIKK